LLLQPLAHPIGGNFRELVYIISFPVKQLQFRIKSNFQLIGVDTSNISYGQNIYRSYTLKLQKYHHYIGDGKRIEQVIMDISFSYLLKPAWHLRFESGYRLQLTNNVYSGFIYVGLKTSLFNNEVDY